MSFKLKPIVFMNQNVKEWQIEEAMIMCYNCLLYTSDAADE